MNNQRRCPNIDNGIIGQLNTVCVFKDFALVKRTSTTRGVTKDKPFASLGINFCFYDAVSRINTGIYSTKSSVCLCALNMASYYIVSLPNSYCLFFLKGIFDYCQRSQLWTCFLTFI